MQENNRERIGKKILSLRKEKGLTQQELAEQVGINRVTLTNIELGKFSVSLDILTKIANALGCELEFVENGNR